MVQRKVSLKGFLGQHLAKELDSLKEHKTAVE